MRSLENAPNSKRSNSLEDWQRNCQDCHRCSPRLSCRIIKRRWRNIIPASFRFRRPENPIAQIDPELHYATVHKTRDNGTVVQVEQRIVFGKEQDIHKILEQSPVSHTINTADVERNNLTLRQHSRRLTRKTNGFSKVKRNLEAQVLLVMAYYNFVLAHGALKIKGPGERTPAMAAGITDHKWSMIELLTYRILDN